MRELPERNPNPPKGCIRIAEHGLVASLETDAVHEATGRLREELYNTFIDEAMITLPTVIIIHWHLRRSDRKARTFRRRHGGASRQRPGRGRDDRGGRIELRSVAATRDVLHRDDSACIVMIPHKVLDWIEANFSTS
jgi:hypothetical protein